MPEAAAIRRMFSEVAPGYDRANRVLSLGIDVLWRRRTVRTVGVRPGEVGLDVCAGTGDLSLALARAGARIVGADFCAPMLVRAEQKAERAHAAPGGKTTDPRRPRFLAGDAMRLPFADRTFDFCTVAFGIRNVEDPVTALREMRRVTRAGGRVVVLEFCRPRVPLLAGAYLFYFRRVLPRLGALVSGARNDAYSYLPASVMAFPERAAFLDLMQTAGLRSPRQRILTGGIAAIYRGEVQA